MIWVYLGTIPCELRASPTVGLCHLVLNSDFHVSLEPQLLHKFSVHHQWPKISVGFLLRWRIVCHRRRLRIMFIFPVWAKWFGSRWLPMDISSNKWVWWDTEAEGQCMWWWPAKENKDSIDTWWYLISDIKGVTAESSEERHTEDLTTSELLGPGRFFCEHRWLIWSIIYLIICCMVHKTETAFQCV